MCVCLFEAEITASHFGGGGGLLRKKTGEEEEAKNKTRQELLEELILKSKQEKVKNAQQQKLQSAVMLSVCSLLCTSDDCNGNDERVVCSESVRHRRKRHMS